MWVWREGHTNFITNGMTDTPVMNSSIFLLYMSLLSSLHLIYLHPLDLYDIVLFFIGCSRDRGATTNHPLTPLSTKHQRSRLLKVKDCLKINMSQTLTLRRVYRSTFIPAAVKTTWVTHVLPAAPLTPITLCRVVALVLTSLWPLRQTLKSTQR